MTYTVSSGTLNPTQLNINGLESTVHSAPLQAKYRVKHNANAGYYILMKSNCIYLGHYTFSSRHFVSASLEVLAGNHNFSI